MDEALARMQAHITAVRDDLSGDAERIRSAATGLGPLTDQILPDIKSAVRSASGKVQLG
jgi:hypothetical protein